MGRESLGPTSPKSPEPGRTPDGIDPDRPGEQNLDPSPTRRHHPARPRYRPASQAPAGLKSRTIIAVEAPTLRRPRVPSPGASGQSFAATPSGTVTFSASRGCKITARRRVLRLASGVPRHPVDAPGRLVERAPGLVCRDGLVVEGMLVLALQDVPEHGPGEAVRGDPPAGLDRDLLHRHPGIFPVQPLGDVPP
jgi:hypothetical protein